MWHANRDPVQHCQTLVGLKAAVIGIVTVIGAEAPHSVLYSGDGDDPNGYKSLLDMLAISIANAATNNAILTCGTATIVLNPEHAEVLNKAGLTRQDIAEEIHRRSTMTASHHRTQSFGNFDVCF